MLAIHYSTCSSIKLLNKNLNRLETLLDLQIAEVDLVSHIEKRAFPELEVVHSLGALSS